MTQLAKAHSKDLSKLVQKYDTDSSGNLNAQELKSLITEHYAAGSEHNTSAPPSETEVSWILQAAGIHNANFVDASEIEFALDLWNSYRAMIDAVFYTYDTDQSERLEIDELKGYLTDLSKGRPPKVITVQDEEETSARPTFFCDLQFCALNMQLQ